MFFLVNNILLFYSELSERQSKGGEHKHSQKQKKMFEEVGEQYHQFIAASSRTSLPLSLPFPLHGFDPFSYHSQTNQISLTQLQHKDPEDHHSQEKEPTNNLYASSTTLELDSERSIPENIYPWSSDEVIALHKIRSGTENWFPEFTWEHVSRKLEDLGFKRSAEKCKEKFEEESRHFNSMSFGKNYRLFGELEVICQNDHNAPTISEKEPNVPNNQEQKKVAEFNKEEDSRNKIIIRESKSNSSSLENEKKMAKEKIKRKRHHEFETLKGFCEEIVRKIMTQQEEMHNKIIEDMLKIDEEKNAKDEAWKKQEMERINKEIEVRAHEQAVASERQTKLIEFLQKITSDYSENTSSKRANDEVQVSNASITSKPQNHNPFTSTTKENPSQNTSFLDGTQNNQKAHTPTNETLPLHNSSFNTIMVEHKVPTSSPTKKSTKSHTLGNEGEEIGKRWPREEVLALINLRGSINGNNSNEEKEGTNPRGPLWERISQGMLSKGYKRSAKRCKEKWENINKYFRKTKDGNKKRSMDSRTCPYFQQLSHLYSQSGSLAGPVDPPETRSPVPENSSPVVETRLGSSNAKVLVDEGEKDFV